MRVNVDHTIGDLASDCRKIATTAQRDFSRVARMNAQRGNKNAKRLARQSAGDHGKHYHKAFTVEAITPLVWEYGPDASMPQGGMSFEFGSRNQPPHLDLAKSADLLGPMFAKDVSKVVGRMFWPS